MESGNTLSQQEDGMSEKVEVVVAIGTRPDVLKMEPIITALKKAEIEHRVWWSGQGGDIQPSNSVIDGYTVENRHPTWNDLLGGNIAETIMAFTSYCESAEPALVLVHGDDATAYACAIAAHALDIPVGHIEAGMRTYERDPWPEEDFRRIIGTIAQIHFCPSAIEVANLESERTTGVVHLVGNTINDVLARIHKFGVLVTVHRRENALERTQVLLNTLSKFQAAWPELVNVEIVKHPNWQNRYNLPHNLTFLDPIRDHTEFVEKLRQSDVIVTDSGGLQEECAFLGVDCVVYREQTERISLDEAGLVTIIPDTNEIIDYLGHKIAACHVYGIGDAAQKIVDIVKVWLNMRGQQAKPPTHLVGRICDMDELQKTAKAIFGHPYITPEMEQEDQERMRRSCRIRRDDICDCKRGILATQHMEDCNILAEQAKLRVNQRCVCIRASDRHREPDKDCDSKCMWCGLPS